MKILIVDDTMNLKLLGAVVEAEGHKVLSSGDGVEALKILDREEVDGIISDNLMPRMDGYRLCLEVRNSRKYDPIPFIVYTSTYTSPGDERMGDRCGRRPVHQKASSGK